MKSATSIVDWRNDLVGSVHPAGWAVFGSVDIANLIYNLPNRPRIASVISKDLYRIVYHQLVGMRLGTTDQVPLNPNPTAAAREPTDHNLGGKIYNPALKLATGTAFTQYETLTGSVSGATGNFLEETTYEDGVRVASYLPLTGIFQTGDTITGSSSGRTVSYTHLTLPTKA